MLCPGELSSILNYIKYFEKHEEQMENWDLERKMPIETKYLHCKKNDGNLSVHSGNYSISCDLIFLHFAGGFTEKFKEKWSKYLATWEFCWHTEIMPYSNVDEVKKIFGAFWIKNIFVLGCNKNEVHQWWKVTRYHYFNQ